VSWIQPWVGLGGLDLSTHTVFFVNLTIYIYLSLSTADPTTINVGLLIGKFNVCEGVFGWKAISRSVAAQATAVKAKLVEHLVQPVVDGTVSICVDMFTDDYLKQSYLDVSK